MLFSVSMLGSDVPKCECCGKRNGVPVGKKRGLNLLELIAQRK